MDERLDVLYNKCKEHYSNDVITFQTEQDPKLTLSRISFEDTTINEPILMLGYIVEYQRIPMHFVSMENEKEIEAFYSYKFGIFIALNFNLTSNNEYELQSTELKILPKDTEKLEVQSDISKAEITKEMGQKMNLQEYAQTMTSDIIDQFIEEARNISTNNINHLLNVDI